MTILPLALIAAVGRNGVIGTGGTMPWRIPTDFRHFRQTTMGQPVLMGRKTFASIGRPLTGRFPVVLSRDPGFVAPGIVVAATMDEALAQADRIGQDVNATSILVAGGGTVYAALIGRAARLHITAVDLAPEGDTRFPAIDSAIWRERERRTPTRAPDDDGGCVFLQYERRAKA